MVRKSMKLSSLFRTKRAPKLLRPCQFLPYCAQANTLSFRKANHAAFADPIQTIRSKRFTNSSSTIEPKSFSSSPPPPVESDDLLDYCNNCGDGEYSLEKLVRDVARSSERLFFEPDSDTNSLLVVADDDRAASVTEGSKKFESQMMIERKLKGKEKAVHDDDDYYDEDDDDVSFCESSVFMALESNNPYEDFKKSMEEMVEFHGVKDWERLEELLSCYLIINHKENHEFILRAFFDLFSIET